MNSTECRVLFRPESPELRFLPEGPYALSDGRLSWVSIQHGGGATTGSLNVLDPVSGVNRSYALPGRPGFAFPTSRAGVFVIGLERSLGMFDTTRGSWSPIISGIDAEADNTIINDGVVFEDNLIFGCKELEFKTPKAGLFLWRGRDRALVRLRSDQICSNGKAVVRDESGGLVLYDIDSPARQIVRCPLDIQGGTLGRPEVIVDLTKENVFPDGMILTPDHRSLIVALYDPGDPQAGAARQYRLSDGQLETVWTCPGSPRVTCPQLLRLDGRVQLVLTSAVEGMPAEQLARHPNAGCLFAGETSFSSLGDQPVFPL